MLRTWYFFIILPGMKEVISSVQPMKCRQELAFYDTLGVKDTEHKSISLCNLGLIFVHISLSSQAIIYSAYLKINMMKLWQFCHIKMLWQKLTPLSGSQPLRKVWIIINWIISGKVWWFLLFWASANGCGSKPSFCLRRVTIFLWYNSCTCKVGLVYKIIFYVW